MRPLLLRRLLPRQRQQQGNNGWRRLQQLPYRLIHAARAEGPECGQLVLCCLALAALGTAAGVGAGVGGGQGAAAQQQQQRSEEEEDEEEELFMAPEDMVAHGRRLNVRVSPWLAALPGGPEPQEEEAGGQRGGGGGRRRRPRPQGDERKEGGGWRRPPSKYVIVGLGVTGGAALRALLACEPDAEVTVVEAGPPPPGGFELQLPGRRRRKKGGWGFAGGAGASSSKVAYLWETGVAALDADARELHLSDGSRLGFGKCLLAVGDGRPRVPARFVDPVAVDRCVCVCAWPYRSILVTLSDDTHTLSSSASSPSAGAGGTGGRSRG